MQSLLAEADVQRLSGLDQFWKKQVALELTEDEVSTVDRCPLRHSETDNEPLPQIRINSGPSSRHRGSLIDSLDTSSMSDIAHRPLACG